MPTEEMRMKIRELDEQEAAALAVEEDRAAEDLQSRLRLANGSATPIPKGKLNTVIVPTEDVPVADADTDLFAKTADRMKEDRHFAVAIRRELEGLGHLPHPKWFEPVDFFTANVNFGSNKCTISVASAGAKLRVLLSTRMLEVQRAINDLNAKAAEFKDENLIPMELIVSRNKRIEEMGVLSDCDIFGSTIVAWEGPIFCWPNPSGAGAVPMPLLNTFDLNKPEDAEKAAAIYRRIPRKALEMISHARKILDNFGIEDDYAKGNS